MLKCTKGNCNKRIIFFEVCREQAIIPTECEISDLRRLFSFFLYESPNGASYICNSISQDKHEELLNKMLKSWDVEHYAFVYNNPKVEDELKLKNLQGQRICNWCKRFVCKKRRKDRKTGHKETDFECLMRHLRNSIAHGRVFIIHGGNYISILFEDGDDNGITARIICNRADLKKWKKLIMDEIIEQGI